MSIEPALAGECHERLLGTAPALEVCHAGLECGVIASRAGGMQAVAFGPLISGAHSPSEHVDASTVPAFWRLLCGLLEAFARER